MRIYLLIILLETLFVKQSIQASAGVVKVSIYYESLCPDSVNFITNQLYPAYQKIKSSLLLDFIPYGKASQNNVGGKWQFDCQHYEPECWGNKAQACGLAENKGQDANLEFVNCVMSHGTNAATEEAIEKCAPKLDVTAKSLIDCANGERGDELHAMHGIRTHAIQPIQDIPIITFNDYYDPNLQKTAWYDFLGVVCNLLINKPSVCPSIPPPVATTPAPFYPYNPYMCDCCNNWC